MATLSVLTDVFVWHAKTLLYQLMCKMNISSAADTNHVIKDCKDGCTHRETEMATNTEMSKEV